MIHVGDNCSLTRVMTVQREVNMWGFLCMGLDDGLDVKEEEEWLPEY